MSEKDKALPGENRDVAAEDAEHLNLFEALLDDVSYAKFLNASSIKPLEELDDETLRELRGGVEVEHTPIIITGESAQIDVSSTEYTLTSDVFASTHLVLRQIENVNFSHSDTGLKTCYIVQPNEVCTIVFHCKPAGGGSDEKNIVIQGGLSMSPRVTFSTAEYPAVSGHPVERKVHKKGTRKIVGMEIFRTRNGQTTRVHVCPLIPSSGRCQYSILDPHK